MTIEELVNKYNYKPLPKELSKNQREQYQKELEEMKADMRSKGFV